MTIASHCAGCGEELVVNPNATRAKWCSEKCRKASYGDPCVDCGARTSYGAEHRRIPEPRCHGCSVEHRRRWTRELIIDRIREWAATYGEAPAGPDWNPNIALLNSDPERARRFRDADGYWPHVTSVFRVFPSWNAAIEAAGFQPRPTGGGGGNELRRGHRRRDALREQILPLYLGGVPVPEIARRLDRRPGTIHAALYEMRRDGWDIPYRQRPRKAVAA